MDGEDVRGLLVAEGALRLLWLYARVLPSAMAETSFDVGKLFQETEVDTSGDAYMDADKQYGAVDWEVGANYRYHKSYACDPPGRKPRVQTEA